MINQTLDTRSDTHSDTPVITWDEEMVLGNAQLDAVHQEMSDLLKK